jgi:hypothetical protein
MPIAPDIMMTDGGGDPGSVIDMMYAPSGAQSNDLTSVTIDFTVATYDLRITSYKVTTTQYQSNFITEITSKVNTYTSKPMTVTGLTPGGYYTFKIEAYNNSTKSNISSTFAMHLADSTSASVGVTGNTDASAAGNASAGSSNSAASSAAPGTSFLALAGVTSNTKASLFYKSFSAINSTLGTSTYYPGLPSYITDTITSYTSKYYGIGTSIMLDNSFDNTSQSAGLGIFVDNAGGNGYYFVLESTASAATLDKRSFRVLKVKGSQVMELPSSQVDGSLIDGVIGGQEYRIDVKAKVNSTSIDMVININGFQVLCSDNIDIQTAAGKKGITQILPPTSNIGVICFKGNAAFDYVYGANITEQQFNDYTYNANFYQGQFSNDFLVQMFGDLQYNAQTNLDNVKSDSYEEFGTTVREILKTDIKFDSRPSFPISPSTGLNKLAKIVASKVTNFGATIYTLNNSSSTIPLSDGSTNTFWVYGNTLGQSGDLEYLTDDDDFTAKEQVSINTMWIQNINDVKSLAKWIKSKVVNRGRSINLKCFGNPLIVPGDVIGIKYGLKGLLGTEKFIVTSVTQTYDDGLETEISCRTF